MKAIFIADQLHSAGDPRFNRKSNVVSTNILELGFYRCAKSRPLTNGLGFISPVAKGKPVYSPRRAEKHTLVMSSKGHGPRYQGVDKLGRPVWGDSTEVKAPKVSHKIVKVAKAKKVKAEAAPVAELVFGNYSMLRPGVFRRQAVEL